MSEARYSIAEWYGHPFPGLSPERRRRLAKAALGEKGAIPPCPFRQGQPPCKKKGGVCSLQRYDQDADGLLGAPMGDPVIVCPARFEEKQAIVHWLAEIVDFVSSKTMVAREVPFMEGTSTGKSAGMIDLVVAETSAGTFVWYGLEFQAVYFSGLGMASEFRTLRNHKGPIPPFPSAIRRPDWRSSSAKRLMPQLQVKVPTLRRWASKVAVAVDRPFFDAIGGPSPSPSTDLNDGDVIWLVPTLTPDKAGRYQLSRGHWEVLTLEQSSDKLLAAKTVRREAFEQTLRAKLEPLGRA